MDVLSSQSLSGTDQDQAGSTAEAMLELLQGDKGHFNDKVEDDAMAVSERGATAPAGHPAVFDGFDDSEDEKEQPIAALLFCWPTELDRARACCVQRF